MENTTTNSVAIEHKFPLIQGTVIIIVNSLFAVIGTFGNILIILAVLNTPQIRQKASFLLLSLAVADLLVTVLLQPLYTSSMGLKTYGNYCSLTLDRFYMGIAPFPTMTTVYHLAAISIDRVISTVKPLQHHDMIRKWYKLMLFACWLVSIVFSALLVMFFEVIVVIAEILVLLSFAIMICSYGIIVYRINFPKPTIAANAISSSLSARMEKRVSVTVAILIILFTICYVPHVGFYLANPNLKVICSYDVGLSWVRTLVFTNSSMNFVLYTVRVRHFRVAFRRLLAIFLERTMLRPP